jgi:hypothetical protein
MTTGENSLMDGMVKNDAIPFLLREPVTRTTINEETQEPQEITVMENVSCYLTSPTIEQAITLQKELEKVLVLLDPMPVCRCGELYNAILTDLYGSGDNQGLRNMRENVDLWIQDAQDAMSQVLSMAGIADPDIVTKELHVLDLKCREVEQIEDQELAVMQLDHLRDRIKHLMAFQKAYDEQRRQYETLLLQKEQLLRKITTLEKKLKKFPKNSPHVVTSMDTIICPSCKFAMPVPVEILFEDDAVLEPLSQVLFEDSWVTMRKKVPFSMLKVMLTAVYVWGFKPMSQVQDPFVENMSEILSFVQKRIPKLRNAIPPVIAGNATA